MTLLSVPHSHGLKPAQWNLDPAHVDERARRLWRRPGTVMPLWAGSGLVARNYGPGANGVITGADWVGGAPGLGLDTPGATDRINLGSVGYDTSGDFTMSMVVQSPTGTTSSDVGSYFSGAQHDTNPSFNLFSAFGSGRVLIGWKWFGGTIQSPNTDAGAWNGRGIVLLTVRVLGGTLSIFSNEEVLASGSWPGQNPTDDRFIGVAELDAGGFERDIDTTFRTFWFWPYALSVSDIVFHARNRFLALRFDYSQFWGVVPAAAAASLIYMNPTTRMAPLLGR